MAAVESFDVTSGCDLQEVDNAVNQAKKEIAQRYDFRGLKIELELDRKESQVLASAPDEFKLNAALDVLRAKLTRRGVPTKNIELGPIQGGGSGTVRQEVKLQQGIPTEAAKAIVKLLKDQKLKKVQAAIQGDQVRVSSPSRDTLQEVIELLKAEDFGVELSFGNYR
jgi:uncharacterized protein YajQ (UPF0234 family)